MHPLKRPAALFLVVLISLLAQPGGRAEPPNALNFRTSIFVNGGYAVGGVNLRSTGGDAGIPGIAVGAIRIPTCSGSITYGCLPATGTVVGAFL
ncbi:MAG: hypothetical protein DMF90_27620 [Acidobacteria bacterium]|nr:MAG: hypothetical protein DMF90_27620 [Acidobacteriota bacterium]